MVLRNKDGTIYKLKSPNQLMKNQSIWTEYTLHNMQCLSATYKHQQLFGKINSNLKIQETPKNFIEELESTKESIVEKKSVEIIKNENITTNYSVSRDENIQKTFMFCLPALIIKKRDSLYDEEYNSIEYKNPFSFESVVISEQDLYYKFWSNVQLENESIIYPKSNTKRWWKIHGKEIKGNGFIYNCIPSSYQPHFEGV